jgi:micrococcal nuclease
MKHFQGACRFSLRKAAGIFACCLLLIVAGTCHAFSGNMTPAFVTKVIDGDTVTVVLEGGAEAQVRYLGIDTPELHHPSRGREEFGKEAAAVNASFVLGKQVFLERDVQEMDRYGRHLAWVWIDGPRGPVLINEKLVQLGYAMPFTLAPNVRHTERIIRAFREARARKRGFWDNAERRVFSASQAWAELPALAGKFLTLELTVDKIKKTDIRYSLIARGGRARFVVYMGDAPRFGDLGKLKGCYLRAAGKLVAGYQGPEMTLADPIQILEIRHPRKTQTSTSIHIHLTGCPLDYPHIHTSFPRLSTFIDITHNVSRETLPAGTSHFDVSRETSGSFRRLRYAHDV